MCLTGMNKLIFYVNNFFDFGHFFDPWYWKKDQKIAGTTHFFASHNPFCHARQPRKEIFEICIVFSHFFSMASNCLHYSNCENVFLKFGTETTESTYFMKIRVDLRSSRSEPHLLVTKLFENSLNNIRICLLLLGTTQECYILSDGSSMLTSKC